MSYVAFGVFIATALGRGWALSSCGCFGRADTPPTVAHVIVDLVLAAGAGAAALASGPAPLVVVARRPGWGSALVTMAVVAGGLAYLVLARLPRLQAARA